MPQTIDEAILQGLQELAKATREAEGSPPLVYGYPEEAQEFGRRVAREAFEKHVLQPETLTFEDLKASVGKQEAREILKEALDRDAPPTNLGAAIHELFRSFGGVDLEIPPREPMREPPRFD